MSLDAVSEQIRALLPQLAPLDARVRFVIEDEGVLVIDATRTPPELLHEDGEAACTVRLTEDRLRRMLIGELNPTLAYTLGQIKVEGSLGVAMKLTSLLDSD